MAVRHAVLAATSLVSVFVFAGPVGGWAPFSEVVLAEGFYAKRCLPGSAGACVEQKAAIDRVYTLACFASLLVCLPSGLLVDACGPVVGTAIGGAFTAVSLAGVAVSGSHELEYSDDLFCTSIVLMHAAGGFLLLSAFHMPFLFPVHCTLLIALVNCLYDGSSFVFVCFRWVYQVYPYFRTLFAVLAALCLGNTVLLASSWVLCRREREEVAQRRKEGGSEGEPSKGAVAGLHQLPLSEQVCTWEYLAVVVFAAVQPTRSNFYIGSVDLVNEWIAKRTGAGAAALSRSIEVTALIIPQGWVLAPVFARCVKRFGIFATLQVTTAMGVAYNLVQLVSDLQAQVLGTLIFAAFRAFVFSSIAQYNAEFFGDANLSALMGICYMTSSIPNLLQEPLVSYSLRQADFVPFISASMAINVVPALAMAAVAWRWRGRQVRDAGAAYLEAGESAEAHLRGNGELPMLKLELAGDGAAGRRWCTDGSTDEEDSLSAGETSDSDEAPGRCGQIAGTRTCVLGVGVAAALALLAAAALRLPAGPELTQAPFFDRFRGRR